MKKLITTQQAVKLLKKQLTTAQDQEEIKALKMAILKLECGIYIHDCVEERAVIEKLNFNLN